MTSTPPSTSAALAAPRKDSSRKPCGGQLISKLANRQKPWLTLRQLSP
jgi:hypothetical protein